LYALVYRLDAAWIAARMLMFDTDRTTPAVLLFTGTFMILIALISVLGLTARCHEAQSMGDGDGGREHTHCYADRPL
jgi:hypothetical protein